MKWIGNAFVYFGLFFVYQSTIGSRGSYTTSSVLSGLVLAVPCLLLGAWLIGKAQGSEQADRDRNVPDVISDRSALFFLYLRPFDTTNRFQLTDAYTNLFSWETWERDGFDDIERVVSRTLEATHPLIALGRPGEHRGAARLPTSDLEWKVAVLDLIDRAKLIIIVPGPNPGTVWELEQLTRGNHLPKCLFIMPPSDLLFYRCADGVLSKEWDILRSQCNGFGLDLPEYRSGGALFRYTSTLSQSVASRSLPPPDPVQWKETFQELLQCGA